MTHWYPGATVRLRCTLRSTRDPITGWAKRGPGGELVSVHSGEPLCPGFWAVTEERAI